MKSKPVIALILSAALLLSSLSPALAAPSRLWTDNGRVLCNAEGDATQSAIRIIDDGNGGAFAAWMDLRDNTEALYGQFYSSSSGAPSLSPSTGILLANNAQSLTALTKDKNGNYFVLYMDNEFPYSYYVQKISGSSTKWGSSGLCVKTQDDGSQSNGGIIADGSGGCIVVWEDRLVDGYGDILVQRFDSSGTRKWSDAGTVISGSLNVYEVTPSICSDGNGGALIAWTDYRNAGTSGYDVFIQRILSTGFQGSSINLPGSQWVNGGLAVSAANLEQNEPKMISDGSGGAIITFKHLDSQSNTYQLYAQKTTDLGLIGSNIGNQSWSDTGNSLATTINSVNNYDLCSDGSGGAIVTWDLYNPNTSSNDIFAQLIASDGTVGGDNWQANGSIISSATYSQEKPCIITDAANGALIAWSDSRDGNGDVYAQRVSKSGSMLWTSNGVKVCDNTSEQAGVRICYGGSSGAIIGWEDYRTKSDIYAQKLDSGGSIKWTANGVNLCTVTSPAVQTTPVIHGNVVAWIDARNGSQDIYAQKYDSNGQPVWPGDGIMLSDPDSKSQRILGDISKSGDYYCVVWAEAVSTFRSSNNLFMAALTETTYDIKARAFDENGNLITAKVTNICYDVGNQNYPTICPDGSNGFIIAYTHVDGGDKVADQMMPCLPLTASLISDFGTLLAAEFVIETTSYPEIRAKRLGTGGFMWSGDASDGAGKGLLVCSKLSETQSMDRPSITRVNDDSVVVVWQDSRSVKAAAAAVTQTVYYDIYGQKLSIADGSRQWDSTGAIICNAADNQTLPQIDSLADNTATVVWADNRAGRTYTPLLKDASAFTEMTIVTETPLSDIYAQRFDCSGSQPIELWTANGVDVVINSDTRSSRLPYVAVDPDSQSLVAFETRDLLALYSSTDPGSSGSDIKVQTLKASDGSNILAEPFTVSTLNKIKSYPGITALGVGEAVICWDPPQAFDILNLSGEDTDINIQHLSGLGETVVPATTTTTLTTTTTIKTIVINPEIKKIQFEQKFAKRSEAQVLRESNKLYVRNVKPGAVIKFINRKTGRIIEARNVQVNTTGDEIVFEIEMPAKTAIDALGPYDINIINTDGSSVTGANMFRIEYPEGEIFFYPTKIDKIVLSAAAPADQPRIAYSLSADKPIDIYVYDVRGMKVVYHRKFSAGSAGGQYGYNEIFWDGTSDLGGKIPNGSYVVQAFSNGKMIGQTYFVVVD
ncbi:MAG: hypothetical protein JW782_01070 [Candidatus Saganbacteria bacterium]|nr:hypothetical protein [Candidatus Saganbacteria bacterium]